jgi:hypothetical protein
VCDGLTDSGVDVVDIGPLRHGGGLLRDGAPVRRRWRDGHREPQPGRLQRLKLVREQAKPISADTGLVEIEQAHPRGGFAPSRKERTVERVDLQRSSSKQLLSLRRRPSLRRSRSSSTRETAAPARDRRARAASPVPIREGAPRARRPVPERHPEPSAPKSGRTPAARRRGRADAGIAWDGDFDRCFFFDEKGGFIEGYYIVGLLASQVLKKTKARKIVHDPASRGTRSRSSARWAASRPEQVRARLHEGSHAPRGRRRTAARCPRTISSGDSPTATAA